MKLFKDITIKEKLSRFTISDFDEKIAIVKKWHDYFTTGTLKTDKEKEVAPDYTAEIFIELLGYQGKTAERTTFTSEYTIGSKFPDGVVGLLNRHDQQDVITAVVELKGAMIPLDQPQKREKNYTPIEQGFGYKRLLRNCPFVIVSNFYELRLYNDNEIDYEVWNLDDLLDETDDYFNFRKFYYLLCSENLITETGTSKTESLLSEIRLEEQVITKKFYADYKSRRHLLLQNLYQKNETLRNDPDLLIEMGQKLIDRVIFMCFAEDRGLLPADILQTIKRDFEKSSMVESVWDSLKIAFNYVHRGNESWGIPDGYNGGLFARDDRFDDLRVEGHVLSKIIDFGMYDFADQLSVTILGHIFEQSISDLEEIKEQIVESTNAGLGDITEPKTSKRKKDGIFYTPEYIVDYIVKNSLGAYLREHETKLIDAENLHDELSEREYQKREQVVYTKYQQFLSNVKVLDPACGSGAFLVRVFDYLLEDNRRVGKILGGMFNTDEMYKSILQNNIYGVDLNAESVEITKLSLWLKSAQKGKKLSNLDNNIKCGNSLIDDPAVAGDKAFNWETEFSFLQCHCKEKVCHCEVRSNLGFDVIVGNPPYVRSRDIQGKESDFYSSRYNFTKSGYDLSTLFIEKIIKVLNPNGFWGIITTNKFFSSRYGFSLREYFLQSKNIFEIINLKSGVFTDTPVETSIILGHRSNNDFVSYINTEKKEQNIDFIKKQLLLISIDDFKKAPQKILYFPKNNEISNIISKSLNLKNKLSNFFNFSSGNGITGVKNDISRNKDNLYEVPVYTGKSVWRYKNLAPEYYAKKNSLKNFNSDDVVLVRELSTKNRATYLCSDTKQEINALNSVILISGKKEFYNKVFFMSI